MRGTRDGAVGQARMAAILLCPPTFRMADVGEITVLLQRMASESGAGRRQTYDEVVVLVYDELRRRARRQLRGERGDDLRPTALVNDVYERLLQYDMSFENRQMLAQRSKHCVASLEQRQRSASRQQSFGDQQAFAGGFTR